MAFGFYSGRLFAPTHIAKQEGQRKARMRRLCLIARPATEGYSWAYPPLSDPERRAIARSIYGYFSRVPISSRLLKRHCAKRNPFSRLREKVARSAG
jgi:hypothetical protein